MFFDNFQCQKLINENLFNNVVSINIKFIVEFKFKIVVLQNLQQFIKIENFVDH